MINKQIFTKYNISMSGCLFLFSTLGITSIAANKIGDNPERELSKGHAIIYLLPDSLETRFRVSGDQLRNIGCRIVLDSSQQSTTDIIKHNIIDKKIKSNLTSYDFRIAIEFYDTKNNITSVYISKAFNNSREYGIINGIPFSFDQALSSEIRFLLKVEIEKFGKNQKKC